MRGLAAHSATSLVRERGYGGAAAPRGEAGLGDREEEQHGRSFKRTARSKLVKEM